VTGIAARLQVLENALIGFRGGGWNALIATSGAMAG
jgi:hypothetical protein